MSPVAAPVKAEEAEANAADAQAKIIECEAVIGQEEELLADAVREEVRNNKTGVVARVEKRVAAARAELPRLRRRLVAHQEILAEHAAEAAEQRRAELQIQGDELDAEEREALRGVAAGFLSFQDLANAWWSVLARRRTLKLANPVDMAGYPESALDAIDTTGIPQTLTAVFERLNRAVNDPEAAGHVRHLGGWQEYV